MISLFEIDPQYLDSLMLLSLPTSRQEFDYFEGYDKNKHSPLLRVTIQGIPSDQVNLERLLGSRYNEYKHLGKHIQINNYVTGDYFSEHIDDLGNEELTGFKRTHTLIIQLSHEEEYTGGELVVDGNTIPKKKGSAVIFSSDTPHEVKQILSGQRASLTVWFIKSSRR